MLHLGFRLSFTLVIVLCFSVQIASGQVPKRFDRKSDKDTEQQASEPDEVKEEPIPVPPRTAPSTGASQKGFDWERMTYGGAVWLNFGSFTYIMLNPRVGYYATDRLLTGIGVTYIYSKDNRFTPALEQSVYGINPFVNYNLFQGVGVGAEFDLINADVYIINPQTFEYEIDRLWVPHLFLGASYFPPGQGGFLGIYWNVLDEPRSFYSNPVIRFGFMF